jgi:hypothetical protein
MCDVFADNIRFEMDDVKNVTDFQSAKYNGRCKEHYLFLECTVYPIKIAIRHRQLKFTCCRSKHRNLIQE